MIEKILKNLTYRVKVHYRWRIDYAKDNSCGYSTDDESEILQTKADIAKLLPSVKHMAKICKQTSCMCHSDFYYTKVAVAIHQEYKKRLGIK